MQAVTVVANVVFWEKKKGVGEGGKGWERFGCEKKGNALKEGRDVTGWGNGESKVEGAPIWEWENPQNQRDLSR